MSNTESETFEEFLESITDEELAVPEWKTKYLEANKTRPKTKDDMETAL